MFANKIIITVMTHTLISSKHVDITLKINILARLKSTGCQLFCLEFACFLQVPPTPKDLHVGLTGDSESAACVNGLGYSTPHSYAYLLLMITVKPAVK